MSHIEDLDNISDERIEEVEKLTTHWVFQAVLDFGWEAHRVFSASSDKPQDIAEDLTRDLLDRIPGFNVQQRLYGNIDYKKARYAVFANGIVRQALLVDSKAEKDARTATIQKSQTSLSIRHVRDGVAVDVPGMLVPISLYGGVYYLATTVFVHYYYQHPPESPRELKHVTIACLPNGKLQNTYNPNALDTIWMAGRDAPSLGEDFRVRLNFAALKNKATWRIQTVQYDEQSSLCVGNWQE